MRSLIFKLSMMISAVLISVFLNAQTRSFENIFKMKLKDSGVLLEDDDIRGYYFFYQLDKSSKGRRNYLLRILDQDLNDIKTTNIEESKHLAIVEAKYNGDLIMLKMVHYKEKKITYLSYNKNAELVNTYDMKNVNKYEMASYGTTKASIDSDNLMAIPGKGFVDYTVINSGRGYQIQLLKNDAGSSEGWIYQSEKNAKDYRVAGMLEIIGDILVNVVVKKNKASSKRASYFIQGIDLNSGLVKYEHDLEDKYIHQPLTSYYDKKNNVMNILGVYYFEESKTEKDNGLGLFRMTVDHDGKISDHKYLAYSGDFSKHIPVGRKGQLGDERSYVYFHDIIQNADGSIIAVGEQYRRTADAAGIASNALSLLGAGYNGAAVTKLVIEDLVLGHFTSDFSINSIEFIEKTKTNFTLTGSFDFVNIHYISLYVKSAGGFDYMFTQQIDRDEATAICYLDFEKQEKGGKKWIFGATTFKDGEFHQDKLMLERARSKDKISVMRAKPGYILVTEYIKSDKRMDIHLERINY